FPFGVYQPGTGEKWYTKYSKQEDAYSIELDFSEFIDGLNNVKVASPTSEIVGIAKYPMSFVYRIGKPFKLGRENHEFVIYCPDSITDENGTLCVRTGIDFLAISSTTCDTKYSKEIKEFLKDYSIHIKDLTKTKNEIIISGSKMLSTGVSLGEKYWLLDPKTSPKRFLMTLGNNGSQKNIGIFQWYDENNDEKENDETEINDNEDVGYMNDIDDRCDEEEESRLEEERKKKEEEKRKQEEKKRNEEEKRKKEEAIKIAKEEKRRIEEERKRKQDENQESRRKREEIENKKRKYYEEKQDNEPPMKKKTNGISFVEWLKKKNITELELSNIPLCEKTPLEYLCGMKIEYWPLFECYKAVCMLTLQQCLNGDKYDL
ncbi:predicted protein, partial [Naegleria gruberi]